MQVIDRGKEYNKVLRDKEEYVITEVADYTGKLFPRRNNMTVSSSVAPNSLRNVCYLVSTELVKLIIICYDSTEQSTRLSNMPEGSRCKRCLLYTSRCV